MTARTPKQLIYRQTFIAILLVIGLYILIPQLKAFRASWHLLSHPVTSWAMLALVATGLTYLAAAVTYCLLAFKPLGYWRTVTVQLAAMFVNRLVPGGFGALGTNYAFLRSRQHSASQALTIVSINNLLGLVGHTLILAATLLLVNQQTIRPKLPGVTDQMIVTVSVAAVALLTLGLIVGWRRVHRFWDDMITQLRAFRQRSSRLLLALCTSMILTLCNTLAFAFCLRAMGVHLAFALALLVFTLGVGLGTATPTPGGLGGFEAGLVAGLVAYHVDASAALAIALLYRVISYWVPLVIGAIAFVVGHRWQLFSGMA